MSQKLDARPVVPRVDDAAEQLLTQSGRPTDKAAKAPEGIRLDLCDEALDLSLNVSKVARLANIARLVVADVMRQQSQAYSNDQHTCLMLTKEQMTDLVFMVDHLEEAARETEKSFEIFDDVLTDHVVTKRSDGGVA